MGAPTARAMAPAVDFCRVPLLWLIERRPAAVFFFPAGAFLACVVQEPPRDIFPDGVAAEEADSIHGLNFQRPLTAPTGDAQHVVLDLRQLSLLHPNAVSGARVLEQRFPIFSRKRFVWAGAGTASLRAASAASFPSVWGAAGASSRVGRTGT